MPLVRFPPFLALPSWSLVAHSQRFRSALRDHRRRLPPRRLPNAPSWSRRLRRLSRLPLQAWRRHERRCSAPTASRWPHQWFGVSAPMACSTSSRPAWRSSPRAATGRCRSSLARRRPAAAPAAVAMSRVLSAWSCAAENSWRAQPRPRLAPMQPSQPRHRGRHAWRCCRLLRRAHRRGPRSSWGLSQARPPQAPTSLAAPSAAPWPMRWVAWRWEAALQSPAR